MVSWTQWTWVWVNFGTWWWTEAWYAAVHGIAEVGHDWETELNWTDAILLFTALDFIFITSHIHNWVLFSLWLLLFILSGVISPLISSSILSTHQLGNSSFSVLSFCLFILFMGFSRKEYWSDLPFPSPVGYVLSELPMMTHPSWVALQGIVHSFFELDKAVVHVIRLLAFLWLLFSFCLPSDGEG